MTRVSVQRTGCVRLPGCTVGLVVRASGSDRIAPLRQGQMGVTEGEVDVCGSAGASVSGVGMAYVLGGRLVPVPDAVDEDWSVNLFDAAAASRSGNLSDVVASYRLVRLCDSAALYESSERCRAVVVGGGGSDGGGCGAGGRGRDRRWCGGGRACGRRWGVGVRGNSARRGIGATRAGWVWVVRALGDGMKTRFAGFRRKQLSQSQE